jgi:hypothetical protein
MSTAPAPRRAASPAKASKRGKPGADWEAIEREYRAGNLSVAEIGQLYGVSRQGIEKHARAAKPPWIRDLTPRVKREIRARLTRDTELAGTDRVAATDVRDHDATVVRLVSDRAVQVVREHRDTLRQGHALVRRLITELVEATEEFDAIERTVVDATSDDRDSRRRAQMLRAISLPARAATMRDLAAAAKTLITLERQAFGIDDDHRRDQQPSTLGSLIDAVIKHRKERDGAVIDITPVSAHSEPGCPPDDKAK